MRYQLYRGARVFDGEQFREDRAVLTCNGIICALVRPGEEIPPSTIIEELQGGIIAPGFIDAQVNGGAGIMLNDGPTPETMLKISQAHLSFGVTSLLPTLITDTHAVTGQALAAAAAAVQAEEGVAGLHLEGPHLAPSRRGAHLAELMRPIQKVDIQRLINVAQQIKCLLITVAAEQITTAQISELTQSGVIVSIGHSDCSYATAMACFDAGATGVTHLFNAMSQIGHRAPGLAGAALEHPSVWAGIIADGHHVDPAVLRLALRAKREPGRLFFVTDAMSLVGLEQDSLLLNGREIRRVHGGGCSKLVLEDGLTLAGSDLNMAAAIRYGTTMLDLSAKEALRMATSYPAQFLGLNDRGNLMAGTRADFVHLSDQLQILSVWRAGKRQTLNFAYKHIKNSGN